VAEFTEAAQFNCGDAYGEAEGGHGCVLLPLFDIVDYIIDLYCLI